MKNIWFPVKTAWTILRVGKFTWICPMKLIKLVLQHFAKPCEMWAWMSHGALLLVYSLSITAVWNFDIEWTVTKLDYINHKIISAHSSKCVMFLGQIKTSQMNCLEWRSISTMKLLRLYSGLSDVFPNEICYTYPRPGTGWRKRESTVNCPIHCRRSKHLHFLMKIREKNRLLCLCGKGWESSSKRMKDTSRTMVSLSARAFFTQPSVNVCLCLSTGCLGEIRADEKIHHL